MSKSTILAVASILLILAIGAVAFLTGFFQSDEIEFLDTPTEIVGDKAQIPSRSSQATTAIPTAITKRLPPEENQKHAVPVKVDQPATHNIVITVSGRAIDTQDNPVVGANIEIVSVNGLSKKLARTISDGQGYFRFDDEVIPPQQKNGNTGTINVFGTAPGYGFAWHGMRSVYRGARPATRLVTNSLEQSYYQSDKCVMNLVFGQACDIEGIVVDENNNPIRDVSVLLRSCDHIDKKGKHSHQNFREFWGLTHLPESSRLATTGSRGRFQFKGMPPECLFILAFKNPERANKYGFVVTTVRDIPPLKLKPNVAGEKNSLIQKSPMRIQLDSTRTIQILCVHPWSQAPIAGAKVHAFRRGKDAQSSYGKTNAQGQIELKLPPGTYTASIDPPEDSELIRTRHTIAIKDDNMPQELTLAMNLAAVVTLEAVDAQTGQGLVGVSFILQDDQRRSSQIQRNLSYIDNPTTDKSGQLKVLMRPGPTRIAVGWNPVEGYKNNSKFRTLTLESGKKKTVRFELEREKK